MKKGPSRSCVWGVTARSLLYVIRDGANMRKSLGHRRSRGYYRAALTHRAVWLGRRRRRRSRRCRDAARWRAPRRERKRRHSMPPSRDDGGVERRQCRGARLMMRIAIDDGRVEHGDVEREPMIESRSYMRVGWM